MNNNAAKQDFQLKFLLLYCVITFGRLQPVRPERGPTRRTAMRKAKIWNKNVQQAVWQYCPQKPTFSEPLRRKGRFRGFTCGNAPSVEAQRGANCDIDAGGLNMVFFSCSSCSRSSSTEVTASSEEDETNLFSSTSVARWRRGCGRPWFTLNSWRCKTFYSYSLTCLVSSNSWKCDDANWKLKQKINSNIKQEESHSFNKYNQWHYNHLKGSRKQRELLF